MSVKITLDGVDLTGTVLSVEGLNPEDWSSAQGEDPGPVGLVLDPGVELEVHWDTDFVLCMQCADPVFPLEGGMPVYDYRLCGTGDVVGWICERCVERLLESLRILR